MSKFGAKMWFSAAVLLIFGGVIISDVSAQTRRGARNAEAQTRDLVQRIRVQSDNFRASFDNAIQNVRLRGAESDNINRSIEDYERAVGDFEDRLNSRQSNVGDVEQILDAAAKINSFLNQTRLGARVNRDWSTVKISLNQLAREYGLTWNGDVYTSNGSNYPNNNPNNNYPNNGSYGSNSRLTGTFRLDTARSDDPREAADRAVVSLPNGEQDNARQTLEQRLETPEMLAIEQRSRQITIASSRAPRYTFEADGRDKYETGSNGTNLRVRATLLGDRLEVLTTGDRGNDYNVTFEAIDNGRSLRVTRRISTDFLRQPVTVTSVYEKTAQVAQLDIYESPNQYPRDDRYPNNGGGRNGGGRNGTFVIRDGTTLRATINETLSTKTAQDNERFTMTVQTPDEYKGAIIEGYVTGLNRSGKVTGRASMNFNFETIRLRNGQSYDFSGFVESIRNLNGDEVKIDNEGGAKGGNQTKQTATRGAVGAAVGALIGAIAGGGKGAAIGAVIGAGAGAGSVYIEGREDLEINSGSDVYIRASAPRGTQR